MSVLHIGNAKPSLVHVWAPLYLPLVPKNRQASEKPKRTPRMATYDLNRTNAGGHFFGGRLSALISAIVEWNDNRVTRKALSALSDRELDDIGLVRGDIERITIR